MTTSALLRRQTVVLIDRRPSIGRDGARLNAPDGRQIEPATAMLNDHLNHHLALFYLAGTSSTASKATTLDGAQLPHQPNPHSRVRGSSRAPSPAGSFFAGFRTPGTVHLASPASPASETLHTSRH